MDTETQALKDRCMRWVSEYNYTECGILIEKEFVRPPKTDPRFDGMTELEYHKFTDQMYLNYSRVDYRRIRMLPFLDINQYETYVHDPEIDPRVIYIADKGNHCIRRIMVK